jgi:hypothetical protein
MIYMIDGLLQLLLESSAKEPDQPTRFRVRDHLNNLSLTAAPIKALLQQWLDTPTTGAAAPPHPARKKRKSETQPKAGPAGDSNPGRSPHVTPQEAEEGAVAALEMLQWKRGIEDAASLVHTLLAILRMLFDRQVGTREVAGGPHAGAGHAEAVSRDGEGPVPMEVEKRDEEGDEDLTAQSYVMQLVLDAIRSILEKAEGSKPAEVCPLYDSWFFAPQPIWNFL